MTGTSKALRRFGVAGLSAVVATVGLGTVSVTSASAAAQLGATTKVTLDKHSDSATVGTCNAYTATVDPNSVLTVQITQTLPADGPANATPANNIGFCTPTSPAANDSIGNGPTATPGAPGTNTDVNANTVGNNDGNCYNKTAVTNPNTSATVSCYSQFTDTGVPGDGKIVFGVRSTDAGTMNIDAFGDTNASGTVGVHDAAEPGDSAVKTWVANNPNASTDTITCQPTSASNPAGTKHTFTCTVKDANGVAVSGATNVNFAINSGPDAGVGTTSPGGSGATCSSTGNNDADNPSDVVGSNAAGVATCSYTNNGTPGTDVIQVYLEQNGQSGLQSNGTEPNVTIQKTWVLPSPQTSVLSLDCSPNETQAPTTTNSGNSACQEPLSQSSVTITASVVNGSPAAPVSGVVVQFDQPGTLVHSGQNDVPDTDTESVSPTTCTTDASGKCSVTFTDTTPTEGEIWTVTGRLPRQNAAADTASSQITYHNPAAAEARNIAVTPKTATQTSGGAQAFVAKVTDRFGNGIANFQVNWSESGPGAFRAGTQCTTDSTGSCTIEVTSLSTETGAETVTASLSPGNGKASPTDPTAECNAAAGQAPGGAAETPAPAGNCTDSGQVTWQKATPPPPSKTKITALINCFSPAKHVLKCKVKEAPAKAGLTVVFKRKTASGVHKIGVSVTNSNGVAKITKRHLKRHKIWRVFAHVRSTSTTTGATTGTDRTRIK